MRLPAGTARARRASLFVARDRVRSSSRWANPQPFEPPGVTAHVLGFVEPRRGLNPQPEPPGDPAPKFREPVLTRGDRGCRARGSEASLRHAQRARPARMGGQHGDGRLSYVPDYAQKPKDAPVDLDRYAAEAFSMLEGEIDRVVPALIALEAPSGGERPGILVALDDAVRASAVEKPGYVPWLIKFRGRRIRWTSRAWRLLRGHGQVRGDHGTARHDSPRKAMRVLRRDASTDQALQALSGTTPVVRSVLDADGTFRAAITTCAARRPNVVRDVEALEEMYRRMVYNVVALNRDDHWKPHGLLMSVDGCRCSRRI